MNDRTRRSYLARYLSGSMDYAERQTFDGLLATDSRLRSMLDAERLINDTIRRDRVAISPEHPSTRRNVMAMLAAMPHDGAGPVAATAAAGGLSALSKILLLSLAGIAALGSYVALRETGTADRGRHATSRTVENRIMQTDSAGIGSPNAATGDSSSPLPPTGVRARASSETPASTDRPQPLRTHAAPPAANNTGRLTSGENPPADGAASEAKEQQGTIPATDEVRKPSRPLPVIRRDSIRVTVSAKNR